MGDPQRILFIRPSALGDVVRSLPVVASLRAAFPEATIDWLVQTEFVDAVVAHPDVTAVIPFNRSQLGRWYLPGGLRSVQRLVGQLRERAYDLVIDGQGLGRSAFLARATRAPRRVGPDDAREFGWLGYTQRVKRHKMHTVERMLELVEAIGVPPVTTASLVAREEDVAWWSQRRSERGIIEDPAVIAPTARWESKRWPGERFAALAEHLCAAHGSVVLVGGPWERNQVAAVAAVDGVHDLLDDMTVGRLMAIISTSVFTVANDSAALHIAAGFHRPCLGLFGPTDPAAVGPWPDSNDVIAAHRMPGTHYRDASLGDRLMREIELDAVIARVDAALREESGA